MAQAYEEECKRLRAMLEELISNKHVGNPTEYIELEEKTLNQKVQIRELKAKVSEVEKELSQKSREERQLRDKIKEYEASENKTAKKKDKAMKQKAVLEEYKAKLQELTNENASLQAQLSQSSKPEIQN